MTAFVAGPAGGDYRLSDPTRVSLERQSTFGTAVQPRCDGSTILHVKPVVIPRSIVAGMATLG